jgi:threonine dehydrogenase-like Zn-dependent dehydrogenase
MQETLAVILEKPGSIAVERIPVPQIPGPTVEVEMKACGICGSDVRYFEGENPWSLHTLGKNIPSPPNMVLGHEVSGVVRKPEGDRRVSILAYKGCGKCRYCTTGRENLCDTMEHFGHSAGWKPMTYYPGGMSEKFRIWEGFEYDIPETISFEEATFLDGLAVAMHAVDVSGLTEGQRAGVVGLGPIGLLAAQVAKARGAGFVTGCDTTKLPVEMAEKLGYESMVCGGIGDLEQDLSARGGAGLDVLIDTVGSDQTIAKGLALLEKSGILVLLAVHEKPVPLAPIALSGERSIVTAANNQYRDFPAAIELLASGQIVVEPLITHRFQLKEARKAFDTMLEKEKNRAFKVVLLA